MTPLRSEMMISAFQNAGIEPKIFAQQLKFAIDRPMETGVKWTRKSLFEHGLFVIQSKRLILLLGSQ